MPEELHGEKPLQSMRMENHKVWLPELPLSASSSKTREDCRSSTLSYKHTKQSPNYQMQESNSATTNFHDVEELPCTKGQMPDWWRVTFWHIAQINFPKASWDKHCFCVCGRSSRPVTKSTVSFRKSPFLFVRSSPEQVHFWKTFTIRDNEGFSSKLLRTLSQVTVWCDGAVNDAVLHAQGIKQGTKGLEVPLAQVLRITNTSHSKPQEGKKGCTTTKSNRLAFASPDLHHMILQVLRLFPVASQAQQGQNLDAMWLDEQVLQVKPNSESSIPKTKKQRPNLPKTAGEAHEVYKINCTSVSLFLSLPTLFLIHAHSMRESHSSAVTDSSADVFVSSPKRL